MNNFDHAAEATATSLNSAGSAMRENEAFQESLEYQTNNLKATFQDLANNVIDKELISSVLKLSNAFLELADTGLGQFITKTALLGGTAWGLSSLIQVSKIIPVITSQFKNLASVIGMISNPAVVSSIGGIGTALSTVGGFAGVALPMLLGISAALVGIVELVDYIENKDVRKLENLSSALQDTNDKIAEMSGAGSEYDTLINNADKLTEKEQERLGVLQAQLDTLKEQAAEQEAAYLKEWQSQQTEQKTETTHKLVTGSADEVPEGAQKLYGQYWDVVTTTEYTEYQRAAENLRTAINNLNSEKRQGVTVGNEYISKLQGIIDEYQETYDTTIKVRDAGYELDDSQQYLVKVMEHQKEVISGLGEEYAKNPEDISQFANSLDESASKLDAYIAALNEYRGANEDASSASATLVNSLFDANGQLTEAAQQALTADGAMASMAQSFIQSQMQAAQADYSTLILAIQEVGNAAMITSAQLANMMAMAGVGGSTSDMKRTYQIKYGKSAEADTEAYNKWLSSTLADAADAKYRYRMQELQKQLDQVSGYVPSGGGGGSSKKSAEEKAAEEAEKQAKKAQKAQEKAAKESQQAYESAAKSAEQAAQEAARAAEQAAEEAKQKILDSIQELKDTSDKFWDSKTDAIEETNKELDRQKQLEEKLKALEEAKQRKILLYKNGQFQWDKDYGTIAKAQADYEETRDKIQRERELEQLEEMKDNATEIFNEMKDIISNGGDVTQEMIDSWLSQMQADGANYYDSNKQMLSEWLDWAKNNIGEFIQSTSETLSGYASSGGLSSSTRGAYGTNASTKGEGYLNDLKYWRDGEFVGLSVAWWMDIFERQIKKGQLGDYTTTDAWLGEIPGSSVFDDWKEVLEYWAKKDGGDPYAMQDMLDRFEAAQIVLSNYADIFKSLGRTDLAELADKYKDLDVSAYHREAILKGVAAHPTDPFGWQSMTPAYRGTKVTTSGQLWRLMSDIIDLDTYLNDYTGDGSPYKTAFGRAFLHSNRDWHINMNDESDRYEFADFNTEELKAAYEENEAAIRKLSEAWFDATKDYEREAIHAQAELRREARDRMEELLGYEPSGKSEAERQANRESSVSLFEKKKAQVAEKNTEDIKDYLSQIKEGSNISQKYINNAREYLGNLIEENSKKWFDLYDQTEKDKLHEQNEQYRAILEQLERAEQVGNVTGGDMLQWEKELDSADEWLAERVKELEAQMAANSKAWWETEDEEERDRLHEENERLAEEIDQLTGTTSTYEGHTGTWSWSGSKNARGTHNFMPKGESGISLVGENGPELRVLTRGDNIIPADQTENLWKWSSITPQAVLATLSSKSSSGNTSYAFDVSRIELPNVTDAKSFVQGLKNYALQYSYKR